MEEIKKVYDDLRTGWEEMKHLLEQQNAEVKKLGEATAETKAAIEKVNEHVSEADAKQAEIVARIDKSEVTKSRPGRSDEVAPALEAKAAMFKMLRYGYNSLDKEEKALFKTARAGSDYEAKAISLGDETQAGFLAPPELVHDIIHEVVLFSPIRNVANVRSTSAKSVLLPIRTGKAAATWIQEVGQRSPGANPTFGMLEVPTHEMYSEILISEQDLEDDQFNIEGEISRSIGEQFGVAEGLAFVSGDGVKQPEGLLTAAGIAYSPGGDANLLLANGLITASYALKAAYAVNATWLMNRKTAGVIRQLTLPAASGAPLNFLWQPGLQAGAPSLLLDHPYVETVDMPDVAANAFPVMFGDFSRGYTIVDRVSMVVKRLQEKYAETGQVAILVRKRVGGMTVLNEAMIKLKISVS